MYGPKTLHRFHSLHLAQVHPHTICTKSEAEKAMGKKKEPAMRNQRHKDSRQKVLLFPTTLRFLYQYFSLLSLVWPHYKYEFICAAWWKRAVILPEASIITNYTNEENSINPLKIRGRRENHIHMHTFAVNNLANFNSS